MQRLEVSGAVRPIYGSLDVKRLNNKRNNHHEGHISRVYQISNLSVSVLDFVLSFRVLKRHLCLISGFRRDVDENCTLRGHYAASSGNFLPTCQEFNSPLKKGQIGCTKTSVRSYRYSLRNDPEEHSYQEIYSFYVS